MLFSKQAKNMWQKIIFHEVSRHYLQLKWLNGQFTTSLKIFTTKLLAEQLIFKQFYLLESYKMRKIFEIKMEWKKSFDAR